jgi:hypothetical protein
MFNWLKPKPKPQPQSQIGNYAIQCKGCGLVLTASSTTVQSLKRVAIGDGWLIGDGYQHCKICRVEAVKRK